MYSRSQNRSTFDELDTFDEPSDEEYELYRYNLPPKYDGNRFRRRNTDSRASKRAVSAADTAVREAECVSDTTCETDNASESAVCPCREECASLCDTCEGSERCERRNALSLIGEHIGYEELLIIAVILMLAGDGGDDIILLLAVLLAQGGDAGRKTEC